MRSVDSGFAALARQLAERAKTLVQARGEMRLRERRKDNGRWRKPRLLWPQFTDRSR